MSVSRCDPVAGDSALSSIISPGVVAGAADGWKA
jgi:hypothetical protein